MFLRRYFYFGLVCLLFLISEDIFGQRNILGKPGYINTPSAAWVEAEPLGFSFTMLPGAYTVFGKESTLVNFYNARAAITSFCEVNLSVAHRPARAEINKLGIGDRHLDFRFRLLNETKYRPSVALGWTPPGSVAPYLAHDYLVVTKNFSTKFGELQVSTGYGSPYIFRKRKDASWFLDIYAERTSAFFESNYLSGFFGAISYQPFSFGGLMLEYDSNTVNAGAYVQPWDWLILQVNTYEAKEFGYSMALSFPLNFSPKSLRRYE